MYQHDRGLPHLTRRFKHVWQALLRPGTPTILQYADELFIDVSTSQRLHLVESLQKRFCSFYSTSTPT